METTRTDLRRLGWAVCVIAAALAVGPVAWGDVAGEEVEEGSLRAFVRATQPGERQLQLEIAIQRYESPRPGHPPVDLVGVVHIGDQAYYEALQQRLDDERALVLFEGIGKPVFMEEPEPGDTDATRRFRTREGLRFLAGRLEGYRQRHGEYPADLEALLEDVAEHAPGDSRWARAATVDHWGREVVYEPAQDEYRLLSLGADGEQGGEGVDAEIHFDGRGMFGGEQETGHMQVGLAEALDLVFQLDVMNYDRPHFRHSDMTTGQLAAALGAQRRAAPRAEGEGQVHARDAEEIEDGGAERQGADAGAEAEGEAFELEELDDGPGFEGMGGENAEMEQLVRLVDGTQFTRTMMQMTQQLLADRPGLQQLTRLMMIEVLGYIDGDFAEMPGLSPAMQNLMHVLIVERNRVVVEDVAAIVADEEQSPESIAIFYGAGHMPDLAEQLGERFGYEATGEAEWLPAFSADLRETGLDDRQFEFLRGMIRFHMP